MTLFNFKSKKIDPIPFSSFSGVHEIPFNFTDGTISSYNGMTKRLLFESLKEHKKDLTFCKFSTALSRSFHKGLISFIDFDRVKVISKQVVPFNVIIRESLEIRLTNKEVCNNNVSFHIPEIWPSILKGI